VVYPWILWNNISIADVVYPLACIGYYDQSRSTHGGLPLNIGETNLCISDVVGHLVHGGLTNDLGATHHDLLMVFIELNFVYIVGLLVTLLCTYDYVG
jgi:hypothetical protein